MTKRTTRKTNQLQLSASEPSLIDNNADEEEEETIHTSQQPSTSYAESGTELFRTPATSIINVTTEEEIEYPTEDEIKSIGWAIYESKETELRSLLHVEYLS